MSVERKNNCHFLKEELNSRKYEQWPLLKYDQILGIVSPLDFIKYTAFGRPEAGYVLIMSKPGQTAKHNIVKRADLYTCKEEVQGVFLCDASYFEFDRIFFW